MNVFMWLDGIKSADELIHRSKSAQKRDGRGGGHHEIMLMN